MCLAEGASLGLHGVVCVCYLLSGLAWLTPYCLPPPQWSSGSSPAHSQLAVPLMCFFYRLTGMPEE